MTQRRTEALRKWAHEEAFVRGDEWPHIPCHAILETLDRFCDEIDDIAPADPTLEEATESFMRLTDMRREYFLGPVDDAWELFSMRTEGYLKSAWAMAQTMSAHDFEGLLDEAYEATLERWEEEYPSGTAYRVQQVLAHITTVPVFGRWGDPIGIKEKKGLVCWLVATGRLPVEQGGGC